MEMKDYTNAQYDFTMALKLDKNDKKKQADHLSNLNIVDESIGCAG